MATPTFTKAEMSREPAKVLEAAKRHGRVLIRSRDGDEYTLIANARPSQPNNLRVPDYEARRKRMLELGLKPLPPELHDWFDRIVAGEE